MQIFLPTQKTNGWVFVTLSWYSGWLRILIHFWTLIWVKDGRIYTLNVLLPLLFWRIPAVDDRSSPESVPLPVKQCNLSVLHVTVKLDYRLKVNSNRGIQTASVTKIESLTFVLRVLFQASTGQCLT